MIFFKKAGGHILNQQGGKTTHKISASALCCSPDSKTLPALWFTEQHLPSRTLFWPASFSAHYNYATSRWSCTMPQMITSYLFKLGDPTEVEWASQPQVQRKNATNCTVQQLPIHFKNPHLLMDNYCDL